MKRISFENREFETLKLINVKFMSNSFLFVKTIEKVIRLGTVVDFFSGS